MFCLRDITIEPAVFREIIKDVKRLRGTGWEQFAKGAKVNFHSLKNFRDDNKSELSSKERVSLCDYIDKVADDPIKAYLLHKHRQHLGSAVARDLSPSGALAVMGDALQSWLKLPPQQDSTINRACAGPRRGRFLLMRRDGDGCVISALMAVLPASRTRPTATFFTFRPGEGASRKGARGLLIEFEGRVHTYALSSHPLGVRTTSLVAKPRGTGVDLQGVRLGLSGHKGSPFAHRIYCYHLPKKIGQEPLFPRILPLLGRLPADQSSLLEAVVDGFPKIYAFLAGGLHDNGLMLD